MARAAGRRKVTIYDIASDAEASAATVSLVLNGTWARYRIREETASRVLEAARRLGYNVNLKARGLRLSRSGLAGMILPHYRNRFFADLAESFEAAARGRALCPIVVSTQRDTLVEAQVTSTLLAQRVEFLFIAGVPDPAPLNQLCGAADVPCVNLDLPGGGAPSIVSDNRAGARRLTEILIAKVERRGGSLADLLYLGGVAGEYATDNRVGGFITALRDHGIAPTEAMLAQCGYPPEHARAVLDSYLARTGQLPSALFVNSIAAFEGLVQFSASLPRARQASLIAGCFDWDPFAAQLAFDVTMLRQDTETMMQLAFDALDPAAPAGPSIRLVAPVLVGAPRVSLSG